MKRKIRNRSADCIYMFSSHWKTHDLPPEHDQDNLSSALIADKIIRIYQALGGPEREIVLGDLLSDIMHLCDRDPDIGTFEEGLETAYWHYEGSTEPFQYATADAATAKSAVGVKRRKK